jgi:hypothetical protein
VGPVSTCGRELLREWWWPIGLMESFFIYTASVRNIFGFTLIHQFLSVVTHFVDRTSLEIGCYLLRVKCLEE